ncbi:hypothetical protein FA15DRAFT_709510 [Coprinopsis marcescibilis]|uniref:Peptidase C14 caspase domain-containing protein n=1 Tax=Coprinopsis marcescibilis TaxID=230819 RepID=A0A5C3KST2_COPMA|nr:hypothetical protein FA15DRAFT_709510 [Coprinopsis marcescibilis]
MSTTSTCINLGLPQSRIAAPDFSLSGRQTSETSTATAGTLQTDITSSSTCDLLPSDIKSGAHSERGHTYELSAGSISVITSGRRRRKALLIGTNYANLPSTGSLQPLKCAHQDVKDTRKHLLENCGYRSKDITSLMDEPGTNEKHQPTYTNIMSHLTSFIEPDVTEYVFLYAGHSGQQDEISNVAIGSDDDDNEPEEDGKDEFIIPVDAWCEDSDSPDPKKIILDNVLRRLLIKPLPESSRFLAILDCCHSATLLDLKHHRCNRLGPTLMCRGRRLVRKVVVEPVWKSYKYIWTKIQSKQANVRNPPLLRTNSCNGLCPRRRPVPQKPVVICIAACKDAYTTEESNEKGFETHTKRIIEHSNKSTSLEDLLRSLIVDRKEQSQKLKKIVKTHKRNGTDESDPSLKNCEELSVTLKRKLPQVITWIMDTAASLCSLDEGSEQLPAEVTSRNVPSARSIS